MTYTSREVCAMAGVSYRQLDTWCRRGLVTPVVAAAGAGSHRAFSVADVERVRVVAAAARARAVTLAELVPA